MVLLSCSGTGGGIYAKLANGVARYNCAQVIPVPARAKNGHPDFSRFGRVGHTPVRTVPLGKELSGWAMDMQSDSIRCLFGVQSVTPGHDFEFGPDGILDRNHRSRLKFESREHRAKLVNGKWIVAVHQ